MIANKRSRAGVDLPSVEEHHQESYAPVVEPESAIHAAAPVRILRLPEVMATVGLRSSMIYELEKEGRFPKRVKITSDRAVGWVEGEIQAWLAQRIRERDGKIRRVE
jgi:prophage regulatory protein